MPENIIIIPNLDTTVIEDIEFFIPSDMSEPDFRTKKWEFEYIDGIPVPENTPYRILVMKNKKEAHIKMRRLPSRYNNIDLPLVEKVFVESMVKRDPVNNASSRKQYIGMAKGNGRREKYIESYRVVLTKRMREGKSFQRYFAKYKLSEYYDKVFEINKQNFGMDTPLYDKVSIFWQLEGTKEEVLKKNIESLEMAEERMWGIRDFLNPLEFYKEEISPEEVLQKRLSKLKFIPGDSEEPFEPGKYNRQRGSKRSRTKQTRSGYHERTQEYTNRGETSGY
tara:strand:- start:52 stop:891 length:840 start_codon:yes stop_codon:yes gene_type:complete